MRIYFKNQFYPIKSKRKAIEKLPRKELQALGAHKNGIKAGTSRCSSCFSAKYHNWVFKLSTQNLVSYQTHSELNTAFTWGFTYVAKRFAFFKYIYSILWKKILYAIAFPLIHNK